MAGDKKIPELPIANAVNGNEPIEIVQGGVSKQSLLSVVATYIKTVVGNLFNSVRLSPSYEPVSTEEGEIYWNGKYYTPQYDTGLGVTIRDGDTEYWVFYNDLGVTIPSGKTMHLLSGFVFDGETYPTFEYADSSTWEKVQGTLAMTMHSVSPSSLGILAKSAQKIECNTSGVSAGSQLWISSDGSGDFTDTKPQYPNIAISIGGSYDSSTTGKILFNQTTDINELFNDAWDGSILETFSFTVSSNGTIVTGSLENVDDTRDLVIRFSDNLYTFDTTPAATVVLTSGTDTNPTTNYVYIPKSTKVLTVSTSGFPSTEHAKIAQLAIQSAATLQTEGGAVRNQNINDHLKYTDDNGHILHIAERIRQLNAQWDNGTESTLTGTTTNGYIQVTSGQIWQMHKQTFPSFSMPTDNIQIVNDNTTAYRRTNNLNTISTYSDGTSWNNEWSKIVIWGVANKTGEVSFVMCNIPSGGYNSEANAVADALNYANYSIPDAFKGVGFLIASFAIRISSGVITYNSSVGYQDLRGFFPNTTAGSAGGGSGITTLLALTDITTTSYTGKAGYVLTVNPGETDAAFAPIPEVIQVACSDLTTALTTGTSKAYFRMPYAMTLTDVRASLLSAGSTSGTTTIDINESGTTVLSTKLTIDFGEKTSETAATAPVISDSALAGDAEITIDIDAVTGGADETGLIVTLIGTRV